MNILAHAYLSGRNEDVLIGNFMGDFVKGDPAHPRHGLTAGELSGVRLHRAIDAFTDAHPDVAAVRDILRPRCHKYAGAAVDVFFDHFLSVQFELLTGESLTAFTGYFYGALRQNAGRLPGVAVRMLDSMVRYDWLSHYQTLDGINRSLTGISRRTAFPSGLDTAVLDLEAHYDRIGAYFAHYWPQLTTQMARVRTELLGTT